MAHKKSVLFLLLSVMIIGLLSACRAAQGVALLPTLTPTLPSRPTLFLPVSSSAPEQTPTLTLLANTPVPERKVTPVPPTVPWVPAALSPIPAPAPERILFPTGATQATVEGYLPANGTKVYVMGVAAGQFMEMSATVGAMGQGLRIAIVGADGTVVKPMGEAYVRTVVPLTQDYYVELGSNVGAASYQMSVLIPVRIRFAPGTISAELTGRLPAHVMRHYVLHALGGQRMIVVPRAIGGQAGLVISGVDGQVLLSGRVASDGYDGILPTTQDYLITVQGLDDTSIEYTMEITIPPL